MRSNLFEAFNLNTEEGERFKTDLSALVNAGDEVIQRVFGYFLLPPEVEEPEHTLAKIASETETSYFFCLKLVRAIRFFLSAKISERTRGDAPDEWADDLITLDALDSKKRERFVEIAARIQEQLAVETELIALRREAEVGLFPYLDSVGTTVELRAVNKNPFKPDIESYQPEICGVVGIVSVNLRLDEGPFDNVYFQVGRAGLKKLISRLNAALSDLDALEQFSAKRKEQ